MTILDSIDLLHVTGGAAKKCSPATMKKAGWLVNNSDGDLDGVRCRNGVVQVHSEEGGDWVSYNSAK
jgi:hypothetical protein